MVSILEISDPLEYEWFAKHTIIYLSIWFFFSLFCWTMNIEDALNRSRVIYQTGCCLLLCNRIVCVIAIIESIYWIAWLSVKRRIKTKTHSKWTKFRKIDFFGGGKKKKKYKSNNHQINCRCQITIFPSG